MNECEVLAQCHADWARWGVLSPNSTYKCGWLIGDTVQHCNRRKRVLAKGITEKEGQDATTD